MLRSAISQSRTRRSILQTERPGYSLTYAEMIGATHRQVSGCAPPDRARDGQAQDRTGRRVRAILRVAVQKSAEHRPGRWAVEDSNLADELDPPQLRPVVVVAVDRERGMGVLAEPPDTRGFPVGPLGLVVNRRPYRRFVERVAHR